MAQTADMVGANLVTKDHYNHISNHINNHINSHDHYNHDHYNHDNQHVLFQAVSMMRIATINGVILVSGNHGANALNSP
jgi:hypothetical protein